MRLGFHIARPSADGARLALFVDLSHAKVLVAPCSQVCRFVVGHFEIATLFVDLPPIDDIG